MISPRPWRNGIRHGLHLLAAVCELPATWTAPGRVTRSHSGHARLSRSQGLWLFDSSGDARQMGQDGGRLLAGPTRRLLELMRYSPGVMLTHGGRRSTELAAAVPAVYREEARCWAEGAGCDAERLLRANSVADACCTALVAGAQPDRPLVIGRNLDFFPAGALGRSTMIALLRREGMRQIASVTWPGFNGVLSGINDAGLTGCILLNLATHGGATGMPISYRVREILEQAATCEEAARLFAAVPVASSHYLLLADASAACVVWQDHGRMRRHDLADGWLSCSNGARGDDGLASDDRGRHLDALRGALRIDDAWMRETITGTYLPGINAQAMVFVPARRELQLALGDAYRPAALNPWAVLPLADAFAGAPLGSCTIQMQQRPPAAAHYSRRAS